MESFTNPLNFDLCNITDIDAAAAVPRIVEAASTDRPSTGTSDKGLFASPFSLASGSPRRSKIGSTLGVVYVGKVLNVCGGVIQGTGQSRFCCKLIGACTTKAHKDKVNLEPETLYVRHSRNGHARMDPNLAVRLLPEDVSIVDLMAKEHALEVWGAYFESLKEQDATSKSGSSPSGDSERHWEEVEVATLEILQAANSSSKTSKKLKLGAVLSPETLPVARPKSSVLSEITPLTGTDAGDEEKQKIQQALQIVMSEWNKLNSMFQMIHMEFDTTGLGETKYRNIIAETLGELQEAIRGTDARLQLLGAGIGKAITDTEEGPMSVWEAMQYLRGKIQTTDGCVDGHHLYLDELKNSLPNWGKTLASLATSYQINFPKINKNLNALGARILAVESIRQPVAKPQENRFLHFDVPPMMGVDSARFGMVLESDFEASKRDIEAAFQAIRASIECIEVGVTPNAGATNVEPRVQDFASGGLEAKVDRALKRLGEIEGRATGESFSMHGQVFCSRSEVADWLLAEKVPSCGFFWDLFSVMVSMKPKKHSGKERSDESYSARRTKSTMLENDLGAAMTHVRPEVLYAKKGSGELERLESGFAACSSYAVWVTGTECYKDQLTGMLSKFIDGVLGTVPYNASYSGLVNVLMGSIRMQWHNMCTFIDSFYVELTGVAGFNKEKAWKLVGRCVAALFAALEPYRSPVTMLEDLSTLENKASCLWAVLQCHRVGQAFDLVKYRGHPAVVKEMSLFMLTERVDPSEIEHCTDRSKKAEKEASDAKSEVAKLKDLVNSMNREFKSMQAEMKALKAKK
jgi:hypothetical protein